MTTLLSRFAAVPALAIGLALSACTVESDPYPAAVPVSGGAQVYVESPPPPPPPQPEVVLVRPSVEHEWVAGYWGWGGGRYAWRPGRWEHRPYRNAQWQHAHWENRGRGHVWVEGGWRR